MECVGGPILSKLCVKVIPACSIILAGAVSRDCGGTRRHPSDGKSMPRFAFLDMTLLACDCQVNACLFLKHFQSSNITLNQKRGRCWNSYLPGWIIPADPSGASRRTNGFCGYEIHLLPLTLRNLRVVTHVYGWIRAFEMLLNKKIRLNRAILLNIHVWTSGSSGYGVRLGFPTSLLRITG